MKRRHVLMLAGVAVSAWLALFGNAAPDVDVARPIAAGASAAGGAGGPSSLGQTNTPKGLMQSGSMQSSSDKNGATGGRSILALLPRSELIADRDGGHGGRGLFAATNWAPPVVQVKPPPPPPPPPVAPPLPFAYLGKQSAGGQMEVYLTRGEKVIAVRNQAVIENTYRVESIVPPTMTLMYLPLNQIQNLSIGVAD